MSTYGPSANFSTPLFTIVYSPAGLAYTPSEFAIHWVVYLQSLFAASSLPICAVVFSTLMYTLHTHLRAFEVAAPTPHSDHTTALAAVLRTTLHALRLTQTHLQSTSTALSHVEHDLDAIDTDIYALASRTNLVSQTLAVLQNNIEVARMLLGAGAAEDEDGLQMGDDVEVLWAEGGEEDGDENGDDEMEVVEEVIDVEASDELVEAWLEDCWDV
jgi:hypothetical protein